MNKEKLITRIESEIKKSKNRLDAHNQGKRIEYLDHQSSCINLQGLFFVPYNLRQYNRIK